MSAVCAVDAWQRDTRPMSEAVVAEIKTIIYYWWNGEGEPVNGAEDFGGTVQLLIGSIGDERADSFDLIVCSPSRFAEHIAPENWGRSRCLPGGNVLPITGVWLMKTWSRPESEAAVRRVIPAYSPGPDFATVAARIGRVIPWEYDYKHDDAVNRAAGLPDPSASFWHDA